MNYTVIYIKQNPGNVIVRGNKSYIIANCFSINSRQLQVITTADRKVYIFLPLIIAQIKY